VVVRGAARGFRGPDGTWYLPCDGLGGESFLWASRDNGLTWFDTGGRTGGRHSVCAVLKDGSFLALGGKASHIDGYMPQSISRDGGRTWAVSKTPFPWVGPNQQRPALVRLASGRLFFAADWQNAANESLPGVTNRGAYVALSDDEGKTWRIKSLPGVLPNFRWLFRDRPGYERPSPLKDGTLGYAIAAQSPNGVIHLVTSANHPPQHFEMNETWILSEATAQTVVTAGSGPASTNREFYADGALKIRLERTARQLRAFRFVRDGNLALPQRHQSLRGDMGRRRQDRRRNLLGHGGAQDVGMATSARGQKCLDALLAQRTEAPGIVVAGRSVCWRGDDVG
jgi:hypothetical protein